MAKKDNTLLIVGLAVAGVIYMQSNNSNEETYWVNGQQIPVSQLPALGYVQVQGQWYHYSQLDAAANNTGGNAQGSAFNWNNFIGTLGNASDFIFDLINNINATGGRGALPRVV